MLDLILSTVGQGLQWSVLALGVFLTFRILDIADLSVEGSFPLGAAVAATAITAGLGLPPPLFWRSSRVRSRAASPAC